MPISFKKVCDLVLLVLILLLGLLITQPPGSSQAGLYSPEEVKSRFSEDFAFHLKVAKTLSEKEPMWPEAKKEFSQASALNVRNYEPYLGIGRIAKKMSNWTEAVKNYRKAVELNPDLTDENAAAYQGKELIAFTKEAIRRFRRLERETPDDPLNAKNLKNAYYLKRKLAGGCD